MCEFTIAALHHYSCFASMTLPYFIDFMKRALEFGKVRIKLLEMTFKGKQSIFPHQQPLHCLILTFRSNYEAYAITCLHSLLLTHRLCKSTGTTRVTQLLVQQPKILAESTCKLMVVVESEWQYAS